MGGIAATGGVAQDGGMRTRRVVVLAYDGIQSLDLTGPVEVFDVARRHEVDPPYEVVVVGPSTAPVRTTSGLLLGPERAIEDVVGPVDTFVVAGGDGVYAQCADAALVAHVARVAASARRVASVCTGVFLLAAAGLLDGRRVTTHWARARKLAREHPELTVDPDPIFVRDGNVATSAGVTAGIDLCLALVEEDHGRELALAVARQLVVFLKRPGGQAQFSAHLRGQLAEHDAVAAVQSWVADHLDDDLTVEQLARRAAMSPRHFARVFRAETGVTPARYVERVRLEAARRRLEDSGAGVEAIAIGCGFGTAETMRRTFLRTLQVPPSDYRQRFRAGVLEGEPR